MSYSVKNSALIKKLKAQPCFVCGARPVDIDHIKCVGMGRNRKRDDNAPSNLLPLCRDHHIEKGYVGIKTFTTRYNLPIDISGIFPKLQFEWEL